MPQQAREFSELMEKMFIREIGTTLKLDLEDKHITLEQPDSSVCW